MPWNVFQITTSIRRLHFLQVLTRIPTPSPPCHRTVAETGTMGYMGTIKEVCARKARKSSVVSCGHYVRMGELIVRIYGRWVCGHCAYTREYGITYRSAS